MTRKTLIIIAGPTAAGKSAAAMKIAGFFNTAVISADSRQCFRELTIGTAKPPREHLEAVKHYFINSHSIPDEVNAGIFERLALQYAREIFQHNRVAVMCGGTGLYIQAFCEGMDEMPDIPKELRDRITAAYEAGGLTWLQEMVRQKDPAFFETGEVQNPRRLMRALEVIESSGHSITSFRKGRGQKRDFDFIRIGLELPREILHRNIHERVDKMIGEGLVEEVRELLPYRQHNALQTVGYREIFDYLDGSLSLSQAVERIKTNTRRYAKRQMTWFRKYGSLHWFDARDESGWMRLLAVAAGD